MMKLYTNLTCLFALLAATSISLSRAILIQPYDHMLEESGMISQNDANSYQDHSERTDRDIATIIGNGLNRLSYGRMLGGHDDSTSANNHGFSQEMAELFKNDQGNNNQGEGMQEPTLSSSVANLLMNVVQAAAQANSGSSNEDGSQEEATSSSDANNNNKESGLSMNSRGSIMELDTSSANSGSLPSKSDLKSGTSQWFNPKETIPVLKISSMATPSKYKKVYFRSEKKLVDGAFHSPTSEQEEKKSLMKPFNSGVQRRSSRGTSSSAAPPSVLQDGVVDFLKKFRDVYIQTRPASSASGSDLAFSGSSPLASVLSPAGGSRPSNLLMSALNSASMLAMAAPSRSPSSSSAGKPSGSSSSQVASAAASAVVAAASSAANGSSSPSRQPLTAQSYVSFWSQTFPTWVRRMLKQMRRRSLYNSSKRQQHHQHQHSAIGQAAQAAASGAVASVVDHATSGGSQSSSSSSSSSSH